MPLRTLPLILLIFSDYSYSSCFCGGESSVEAIYAAHEKIYTGKVISIENPTDAFHFGRVKVRVTEVLKGDISNTEYVVQGNSNKCGFHAKVSDELLIISSNEGLVPMCVYFRMYRTVGTREEALEKFRLVRGSLGGQ